MCSLIDLDEMSNSELRKLAKELRDENIELKIKNIKYRDAFDRVLLAKCGEINYGMLREIDE